MAKFAHLNALLLLFSFTTMAVITFQIYKSHYVCYSKHPIPENFTGKLSKLQIETFKHYDDVDTFLVLVGYRTSDLNLIGSILDAHPEMLVSDENVNGNSIGLLDSKLKIDLPGIKKYKLCHAVHASSLKRAIFATGDPTPSQSADWEKGLYIPDLWQGTYRDRLKVLGGQIQPKRGELMRVLKYLEDAAGVTVKLVHVIGNPLDDIADIALSRGQVVSPLGAFRGGFAEGLPAQPVGGKGKLTAADTKRLPRAIDDYFSTFDSTQHVLKNYRDKVLVLKSEEITQRPKETIQKLCDHVAVTCFDEFTEACVKGLPNKPPAKSGDQVEWTDDLKAKVEIKMQRNSYFAG